MPIIFLVCARPGVGINMKIMVPEANIHSLAYFNIEFNYRAMMCVVLSPFCYVQSDNVYGTHTILLCTTRLRVWYSLDFVMYNTMTYQYHLGLACLLLLQKRCLDNNILGTLDDYYFIYKDVLL